MKKPRFLRAKAVEAAVSTSDVSRQFYSEWATGDRYWWWLCQILLDPNDLIVEDENGDLYRLPFSTDGEDITFGDMSPVKIEYVDVAAKAEVNLAALAAIASARGAQRVAATYSERPKDRTRQKEGDDVREYIEKLRAKLRLSADATDEEVLAAAETAVETPNPEPPAEPETPGEGEGNGEGEGEGAGEEPAAQQAILVDAAAFKQLQENAALGRKAHETNLAAIRERDVDAAIAKGKVPARSRDSLLTQMKRDDDNGTTDTRDYLASLTENVIPVEARADTSATNESVVAAGAHDQFLQVHMPDVYAKKAAAAAGAGSRSRITHDEA